MCEVGAMFSHIDEASVLLSDSGIVDEGSVTPPELHHRRVFPDVAKIPARCGHSEQRAILRTRNGF